MVKGWLGLAGPGKTKGGGRVGLAALHGQARADWLMAAARRGRNEVKQAEDAGESVASSSFLCLVDGWIGFIHGKGTGKIRIPEVGGGDRDGRRTLAAR